MSKDRESQWVDVIISGLNDQAIKNTCNHITNRIGTIREKNEVSESKPFFRTGIRNLINDLFVVFINSFL